MNEKIAKKEKKTWKPLYYVMGFVFTVLILNEVSQFINDPRPALLIKHNIVAFEKPVPIGQYDFRDLENKAYTFDAFKGKYSVLAFWATWCGYCASEFPKMDRFYQENKDKFNVIPIAHTEDIPPGIRQFYNKLKIKSLPAFWVYGVGLHRHMQIRGYPTFFILDKQARVIAQAQPDWQSGDLLKAVKMLEQQMASEALRRQ